MEITYKSIAVFYPTLLCLYSRIKRVILFIVICHAFGCNSGMAPSVSPNHFKVQTSFMLDGRGVIINTYWGANREHHVLCLDNFSPSWIKASLVHYDSSFAKSKDITFKTHTADGSPMQGNVGILDSLSFEKVVFTNVPFYIMPDAMIDNKNDDGVMGIDVMSKGVWKIDFKGSELTFASNLDSFTEISKCEVFPASFSGQSISVKAQFGSGDTKDMHVDLGYNGEMIVPMCDFTGISKNHRLLVTDGKFNTPALQSLVTNSVFFDTIKIGYNYFITMVSSNEKAQERLMGLSFFKRFDYVIFDFIDDRIYIPKKVW